MSFFCFCFPLKYVYIFLSVNKRGRTGPRSFTGGGGVVLIHDPSDREKWEYCRSDNKALAVNERDCEGP